MAAPVCALLRNRVLAWAWAVLVCGASFAISWMLVARVLEKGTIIYTLGNWPRPVGIEYRIDAVNAFVLLVVTGLATVVMLYAKRSVDQEIPAEKHHYFYAAFILCMTGLLGITATGDAFNVFVFLEISSLSTYTLIALGRSRRALTASFQYLVMGTIGGTFILIAIGLLYMKTGTLNMADMANIIQSNFATLSHDRVILAGFAFLTVGISIKLAFFPLHFWLPNAYTYAPSIVTAFVAATATKVSFYMLLRFYFTIFKLKFVEQMQAEVILIPLAVLAIFVASTVAIFQTNIKRMLAFSSLAQIGYMVMGMALLTTEGLTAGLVHLANHALMKGALFLALGCVMYRIGSVHLDDMRGIGKRMPLTMFAFVLGGLSLIGVPLTVGFISKWALITAILKKGLWPIAILLLISSLLAVVYIWRVVEVAYLQDPPEDAAPIKEAPLSMLVPTWILIIATLYFGMSTKVTLGIAAKAAKLLIAGVSS
jgi:multicomponent Na+:H+ antiporter subunit D